MKLVWFNCLIWALSIFVSSTMGVLKIKIEKTNFCLFLTEWNSRHWGTIKADNWTKMCKTTLPIWYWTEKSGKWNTWKGLTACYIKADVDATPLEIVVAFHSMIFFTTFSVQHIKIHFTACCTFEVIPFLCHFSTVLSCHAQFVSYSMSMHHRPTHCVLTDWEKSCPSSFHTVSDA